jgi:uncharacterized protein YndB with AHSA1/START domain
MSTTTVTTTQMYQLYIKATPEQIWEAITNPDLTQKYFFGGRVELDGDRRRAYGPDGSLWGDEAIVEQDPPHRLVHGWSSHTSRSSQRRSRAARRGRSSPRRADSRS